MCDLAMKTLFKFSLKKFEVVSVHYKLEFRHARRYVTICSFYIDLNTCKIGRHCKFTLKLTNKLSIMKTGSKRIKILFQIM